MSASRSYQKTLYFYELPLYVYRRCYESLFMYSSSLRYHWLFRLWRIFDILRFLSDNKKICYCWCYCVRKARILLQKAISDALSLNSLEICCKAVTSHCIPWPCLLYTLPHLLKHVQCCLIFLSRYACTPSRKMTMGRKTWSSSSTPRHASVGMVAPEE